MHKLKYMYRTEQDEPSHVSRLPAERRYSSQQMVDGLIRRDTVVAAAFFDAFAETVNRLVWKLLGADAEHDDVVHQTFVQIVTSVHTLKDTSLLPSWVRQVTVNTVKKEIRSRRYRRSLLSYSDSPEDSIQYHNPIHSKFLSNKVFIILKQMKPENHLFFALKYVEGNTHEEIAQTTGCSLATAKRKVRRAKNEFFKRAERDLSLGGYVRELEK